MRARGPKSGATGHRERQRAEDEREQRQEDEIRAIGDHEPDLSARDRRDLARNTGVVESQYKVYLGR